MQLLEEMRSKFSRLRFIAFVLVLVDLCSLLTSEILDLVYTNKSSPNYNTVRGYFVIKVKSVDI